MRAIPLLPVVVSDRALQAFGEPKVVAAWLVRRY